MPTVKKKIFKAKLEILNIPEETTGHHFGDMILKRQTKIESNFGFDYNYKSDTDDEEVYMTQENEKFGRWSKQKQRKHLIKLWRMAHVRAFVAAIMIT